MSKRSDFEWDSKKDRQNQEKHGVSFALAQLAFLDTDRVILEDLEHGDNRKALLLSWKGLRRNNDGSVYIQKEQNQNNRRRILAERKENL